MAAAAVARAFRSRFRAPTSALSSHLGIRNPPFGDTVDYPSWMEPYKNKAGFCTFSTQPRWHVPPKLFCEKSAFSTIALGSTQLVLKRKFSSAPWIVPKSGTPTPKPTPTPPLPTFACPYSKKLPGDGVTYKVLESLRSDLSDVARRTHAKLLDHIATAISLSIIGCAAWVINWDVSRPKSPSVILASNPEADAETASNPEADAETEKELTFEAMTWFTIQKAYPKKEDLALTMKVYEDLARTMDDAEDNAKSE